MIKVIINMELNFKLKTKQDFRKYAKDLRSRLDVSRISTEICDNFKNPDFYKFSKNILSFYPFNNEIDLRELYKDNSKNWYLPRVDSDSRGLIIHRYQDGDTLIKSKWGVYEPFDEQKIVDPAIIDVVIIPALMADKYGFRLGYGAGFYDRFIPGLRKDCLKVVPVPEELFVESLPRDHWDIPVDKIITQKNIHNSELLAL
jgi:5-formyltetrahydrofolate cyclo-ligase